MSISFNFSDIPTDLKSDVLPQDMGRALYVALNDKNLFSQEETATATAYLQTAQEPYKKLINDVFTAKRNFKDLEQDRIKLFFKTSEEKEIYNFALIEHNYPYQDVVDFVMYQKAKNWTYNGEKIKNPIGAFLNFLSHRAKK